MPCRRDLWHRPLASTGRPGSGSCLPRLRCLSSCPEPTRSPAPSNRSLIHALTCCLRGTPGLPLRASRRPSPSPIRLGRRSRGSPSAALGCWGGTFWVPSGGEEGIGLPPGGQGLPVCHGSHPARLWAPVKARGGSTQVSAGEGTGISGHPPQQAQAQHLLQGEFPLTGGPRLGRFGMIAAGPL